MTEKQRAAFKEAEKGRIRNLLKLVNQRERYHDF